MMSLFDRVLIWVMCLLVCLLCVGVSMAGIELQRTICELKERRSGERHQYRWWQGCQPTSSKRGASAWV